MTLEQFSEIITPCTTLVQEVFSERTNVEIFPLVGLNYEVKNPVEIKGDFDVAVDCSGSGPAMEAAVPLLGLGGRLCIFGVAHPQAKLTIEPYQVNDSLLNLMTSCFEFSY